MWLQYIGGAPGCTHGIPRRTEHLAMYSWYPPMYWTHIIQGENRFLSSLKYLWDWISLRLIRSMWFQGMSSFHQLFSFFECKHIILLNFFPSVEYLCLKQPYWRTNKSWEFWKCSQLNFLIERINTSFVPNSNLLPRLAQFLYVPAALI